MIQQLIKAKSGLNPCLTSEHQNNKGFFLRTEEIDCNSVKILYNRNENTISVSKDRKVLKTATPSLIPNINENLLLKTIKYCFIPRCDPMVQRYIIHMAENKNYLLLKIIFSSLAASHHRKILSHPIFMEQSLVIPKQIIKWYFYSSYFDYPNRVFFNFPVKFLFTLKINIKNSTPEVDLS